MEINIYLYLQACVYMVQQLKAVLYLCLFICSLKRQLSSHENGHRMFMAKELYKPLLDFTEFSEITLGMFGTCSELLRQEAGPPSNPYRASCGTRAGQPGLRAQPLSWLRRVGL